MILRFVLSLNLVVLASCAAAAEPTWVEIGGVVYGAKPDERGPIGGGAGYTQVVTGGDHVVKDLDSLLQALSQATQGQVVFIPGDAEIDLTTRIYIEQLVLDVPQGVTLAGDRGHQGSQGALLTSDALQTPVMIRAAGPGVRITGLRIRGPNPKRYLDHHRRAFGPGGDGHAYYYKFPTQKGVCDRTCPSGSGQLRDLRLWPRRCYARQGHRASHPPQLHSPLPVQRTRLRRVP